MELNYEEKLKSHITALESSYDKIISILNEDLDKDDESGKLKIKDSQLKTYAEGVSKLVESADDILSRIKVKNDELSKLKLKKEDTNSESEEKKVEEKTVDDDNSASHLGHRLK